MIYSRGDSLWLTIIAWTIRLQLLTCCIGSVLVLVCALLATMLSLAIGMAWLAEQFVGLVLSMSTLL